MDLFQSIFLGLIQGLTEFLPVSSSGHLVIFENLFNVKTNNLVFEVLVHFGTLIAVVIYFRSRIVKIFKAIIFSLFSKEKQSDDKDNLKLALFLIIGTIPAAVIGLAFEDHIQSAFSSPKWASGMLLVTAAILISTRWINNRNNKLNVRSTIFIGIAQALAILPGISRSGTTISAGIFSGLKKSEAAEFSFLLSLPAILGATILQIPDFLSYVSDSQVLINYIIGAIVSAIVGYISIVLLMSIVKKGKFFYFGLYCAVVGILGILFL